MSCNSYRACIVSMCSNTCLNAPNVRRRQWFKDIGRDLSKPRIRTVRYFVCEDHFDFKNDLEKYVKWKIMGGMKVLKKTTVPHKFDCQKGRIIEACTPCEISTFKPSSEHFRETPISLRR